MDNLVNLVARAITDLVEGDSSTVRAQYKHHAEASKKLLDSIHVGLAKHAEAGNKTWGHVGEVKHIHARLQDLHDMLHGAGEYSK